MRAIEFNGKKYKDDIVVPAVFDDVVTPLAEMTLKLLLEIAMKHGHIYLHQLDDGKFHFKISFETVPGTCVEAKSGFNHTTIEDAVIAAIEKAAEIRAQFK